MGWQTWLASLCADDSVVAMTTAQRHITRSRTEAVKRFRRPVEAPLLSECQFIQLVHQQLFPRWNPTGHDAVLGRIFHGRDKGVNFFNRGVDVGRQAYRLVVVDLVRVCSAAEGERR